ncbi:MAG: Arm DNA-binding domain-containing protein [Azoarcus sp.]|jgi:hypothetical protein|nr:Arm DNA-binding domain-containing protein [Azoarcus sp.]
MPLTDTAIRTIKPADRAVKHSDSGGLYLAQDGEVQRLAPALHDQLPDDSISLT